MNRFRPRAIDEGSPRRALTVYSSASQSPMKGSTKTSMRIRESNAGGNHQRQAERRLCRSWFPSLREPYSICHFPFLICHFGLAASNSWANEKWKMISHRSELTEPNSFVLTRKLFSSNPVETISAPIIRRRYYDFEYTCVPGLTGRKQLTGNGGLVLFR